MTREASHLGAAPPSREATVFQRAYHTRPIDAEFPSLASPMPEAMGPTVLLAPVHQYYLIRLLPILIGLRYRATIYYKSTSEAVYTYKCVIFVAIVACAYSVHRCPLSKACAPAVFLGDKTSIQVQNWILVP